MPEKLRNQELSIHGVDNLKIHRRDYAAGGGVREFSVTRIEINGGEFWITLFHSDELINKPLPLALEEVPDAVQNRP